MPTTNPIQFTAQAGSWNDYSMYNRMTTEELKACKGAVLKGVARAARVRETNPMHYFMQYARLLAIQLKLNEITTDEYTRRYHAENTRRMA